MDTWLHPLTRFAHYSLLLGLFGAIAFRCIGLRKGSAWGHGFPAAMIVCAGIAPVVSFFLMLVAVAAMMGQPVSALDWSTVWAIVTTTSFGTALVVRLILLTIAFVALLSNRRKALAWPTAAVLYGCALMTLPWSGHAAAGEGAAGLARRLNDGLHLLAAGLWIGAIGWFTYLTAKAHKAPDLVSASAVLAAMRRFAPLGAALVFVVAVTGVLNGQLIFGLENSAAVLGTTYGQLLAIKIGLVCVMLLCAVRHRTRAKVSFSTAPPSPAGTASVLADLRISLAVEFGTAALVVAVAAFLGLASPVG